MLPPRYAPVREMGVQVGRASREAWSRRMRVDTKGDGSVVTRADVDADHALRAGLAAAFPGDAVCSEELGGSLGPGPTWLVDPIDGTSSFVEGLAHWGPTMARVLPSPRGWVVDCGVVYLPVLDELYYVDGGAWFNGEPIARIDVKPPPQTVYLPSRFHHYGQLESRCKGRNLGGTAAHLALVARGAAEAAIVAPGWQPWDTAAGLALIDAVGGLSLRLGGGSSPNIVDDVGVAFVAGNPAAVAKLVAPGIITPRPPRRTEEPA